MSFVPFSAYRQSLPPDYHADEKRLVDDMEIFMRGRVRDDGAGRALRGAHAESFGLVAGEFEVLDGLPKQYAQGLFAHPRTYDAVVRYSNGVAHIRADRYLGPILGMGIKLFGVPGRSLLDGENSGTLDIPLVNSPVFFSNTAHDYLTTQRLLEDLPDSLATAASRNNVLRNLLTSGGTAEPDDWRWDELLAFVSLLGIERQHLFLYRYYNIGAVRFGRYIARLRIAPTVGTTGSVAHRRVDTDAEDEPFRRTLVAETAERAHTFTLEAQLCADLSTTPVDNSSVAWPEELSPFRAVARLRVPVQNISDERNIEAADATAINPWRTRPEHEPLGELNRLRREVYRRSAELRRRINKQSRREPFSPADALNAARH
ncbi:catalase family protein [Streptomyces sp. DG2A-72]|uniref:catalase family protein n=1 Tax=Streptomyces sp. DG2A-72 TaxID=3051386 RepID=UPI00265BB7FE|nr:catalase family protein [Streptomyces sp. DG2A-72]MDO0939071.1 catalase family protein [Streptomyces sp. DG2A-72]